MREGNIKEKVSVDGWRPPCPVVSHLPLEPWFDCPCRHLMSSEYRRRSNFGLVDWIVSEPRTINQGFESSRGRIQ